MREWIEGKTKQNIAKKKTVRNLTSVSKSGEKYSVFIELWVVAKGKRKSEENIHAKKEEIRSAVERSCSYTQKNNKKNK